MGVAWVSQGLLCRLWESSRSLHSYIYIYTYKVVVCFAFVLVEKVSNCKQKKKMGSRVYVLGSNGSGQLGLDHCEDLMVPQLSFSSDKYPGCGGVKKIACGGNHTVILTDDGEIFVTGNNNHGQLLSRDERGDQIEQWRQIDVGRDWKLDGVSSSNTKIVDISCGWEFTIILTSDNIIYSRGNGPKGELGVGDGSLQNDEFKEILEFDTKDKVKIFTSFQNCMALVQSKSGGSKIYGWGSNIKCQLISPREKKFFATPQLVYVNDNLLIDYVSMGKDFTIFVDINGNIIGSTGNIPKDFNIKDFQDTTPPQEVQTMWSSLHVIEYSPIFKINSFGFNMHKQLFNYEINRNERVLKIAMGSEHGIMLCQEEENVNTDKQNYVVKCWGWGEHGNCGNLYEDKSKIINDLSNEISPLNDVMKIKCKDCKDIKIYGGCANTWIVIES